MADRLNIGLDTDTETTGFFTGQKTISPDVYRSSFVNFYTTSLGLPSLEQETGIDVDEPADLELVEPGTKPERDERDVPSILEMTSLETGEPQGLSTVKFYDDVMPLQFNSYSAYLKETTYKDRIPFVENILEPVTAGKLGEVSFGKAAEAEVRTGVSKTKEAVKKTPSRLGLLFKDRAEMTTEELAELEKASSSFARGAMGLAGPMGALVGSFIGGTTVKNAFGNNSFLPSGPLGMIGEVVHSIQYSDMSKIRAARAATGSYDSATGNFIVNNTVDTGFAMSIGNMGITRAPESGTYSGNTQGLNIEQIKSLEAVSKGYDPRGFNPLNPGKSRSNVVADGGMFISGNKLEGFFRGNGTFYSPTRFTSSAYSMKDQAEKAAATAGVSYTEFQSALSQARAGTKTLAQAIADIKSAKAAQPAAAPSAPSGGEGEGPTITVGGKEYQVGTGAGQVDPGLAAGVVRESERENRESDRQGSGQSVSSSRGRVGGGGGGAYSGGSRGRNDSTGGNRRFADGGIIGYAPGGAVAQGGSGFVDRPPEQVSEAQSVADNRPTQLPEGAFVINAAAVEFAGSNDVKKMLLDAHKEAVRRGITVDKQGNGAKLIDVAISSGEVVVAPHLAKIIGYDRLEKINNRGKAETQERIEENGQSGLPTQMAAATGGFITPPERSPIREKKEAMTQFADQELRNDLDVYLRDNPIAQLGYEIVRSGAYEIRAGFVPEGKTSTLGGFTGPEGDSARSLKETIPLSERTDRPIDEEKGYVFYYAGPNARTVQTEEGFRRTREEPHTDTDMRVLAHELGHVGMRFIEKYKNEVTGGKFGKFGYDTEEYMMRIGDEVVRERNKLPHTKFSLTDPVRNAASMFTSGKGARYFEEKGTPVYKMYENMWLKNSDEARKILERHFDFVPEVKKPKKTYVQKFKELFGFNNKN